MQKFGDACKEVLLASLLVFLNALIVVQVVGLSYGPFRWALLAQTYMNENDAPGGCSDTVDNDADGLIDCGDPECCADPTCVSDPACAAPAPVMGPAGTALTLLVLLLVFAIGLRRRPAGPEES